VANGTAALHLAFPALELGPGAGIIQPAVNFVASANMTKAVGATPVFADICSLDEPTVSPESPGQVLSAINSHPSTPPAKAVGIQTSLHYPLVPGFTAFRETAGSSELPESRGFCERVITLPLYPTMSEDQVEEVCGALTAASGSGGRGVDPG
jgi:dTDP-4-amino-4,6-dideoxygalactose transaminase